MFGILNLNKPQGVTSRDVVNTVQRLVKPVKVGHAGTLDPMATGVLLVCIGPATRLISLLQKSPKTYIAEFTLGVRSDTDDSTGIVHQETLHAATPHETAVRKALDSFIGDIDQVPPAYSAVKVAGQRAYAKARRGEEVTLTAKKVTVHSISVLSFEWPLLKLKIDCGSGTYIRSIARDLGERLGCGGLMSSLERTAIGEFRITDAIDPKTLGSGSLPDLIQDPVSVVAGLPQYRCTAQDVALLKTGRRLPIDESRMTSGDGRADELTALLSTDGRQLLAMAQPTLSKAELQPRMVFVSS